MSAEPTIRSADHAKEPYVYIASGTQTWAEAAQEYWIFPLIITILMMDNASPLLSFLVFIAAFAQLFFLGKVSKPKPSILGATDGRTKPSRTVLLYVVLVAFIAFLLICTFQQIKVPVGTAALIGVASFAILTLNAKFNVPSVHVEDAALPRKEAR